MKNTKLFAAYEKAIEGQQFIVGRYNTWMNYYAIFVGALFLALYTIWPQQDMTSEKAKIWFLPAIITLIGWIASLGWYGALLGYRKWNGHWMMVVHKIEKTISNKGTEEDFFPLVYGDMPGSNHSHGAERYMPGYLSTQKITGTFIFFVALAWIAVFGYTIYCWTNCLCASIYSGTIVLIATLLIWILFHYLGCRAYCSTISQD